MTEEWKVAKQTSISVWEISNYGNIKRNGEIYNPEIREYIRKDGSKSGWKRCGIGKVHRVVWQTFNGPIPKGMEIDHIDTNGLNNRLDNLRLVTHTENMNNPLSKKHSSDAKKGENHPMWGKKHSKETVEKHKKLMLGNSYGHANLGKKRVYNEDGTYKYINVV